MDSENVFDPQAGILADGKDPVLVILDFELGRFENSAWLAKPLLFGQFDDPAVAFAQAVATEGLARSRLGIDRRWIGSQQYQEFAGALPDARIEDGFGIVERVRLVKSAAEIELMRKAARFTDTAVEAGFAAITSGPRDYDVAAAIMAAPLRARRGVPPLGPVRPGRHR